MIHSLPPIVEDICWAVIIASFVMWCIVVAREMD